MFLFIYNKWLNCRSSVTMLMKIWWVVGLIFLAYFDYVCILKCVQHCLCYIDNKKLLTDFVNSVVEAKYCFNERRDNAKFCITWYLYAWIDVTWLHFPRHPPHVIYLFAMPTRVNKWTSSIRSLVTCQIASSTQLMENNSYSVRNIV